jgi:hypothetical protein
LGARAWRRGTDGNVTTGPSGHPRARGQRRSRPAAVGTRDPGPYPPVACPSGPGPQPATAAGQASDVPPSTSGTNARTTAGHSRPASPGLAADDPGTGCPALATPRSTRTEGTARTHVRRNPMWDPAWEPPARTRRRSVTKPWRACDRAWSGVETPGSVPPGTVPEAGRGREEPDPGSAPSTRRPPLAVDGGRRVSDPPTARGRCRREEPDPGSAPSTRRPPLAVDGGRRVSDPPTARGGER